MPPENERFGRVFAKTGSINSGTGRSNLGSVHSGQSSLKITRTYVLCVERKD